MHSLGQGVAKSDELALQWFLKAVEQGNMFAMELAGQAYHQGLGTPKNLDLASHYYEQACQLGLQSACAEYNHLNLP